MVAYVPLISKVKMLELRGLKQTLVSRSAGGLSLYVSIVVLTIQSYSEGRKTGLRARER